MRSAVFAALLGFAAFVACASPAHAQDDPRIPFGRDGQPEWVPAVWIDFPVRIKLQDREQLAQLLARVPIRSFDREQVSFAPTQTGILFQPRVTDAEYAALVASGYAPEKLRDYDREGREEAERVWREMAEKRQSPAGDAYPLTYYPTNDQIGTMLQGMQSSHPTKARYFTWGSSVNGRTLHGVVISDHVGTEEREPEVRLSSAIHGDEVVGMVMLLNFAHYLLQNYGEPGMEAVTNLVDDYEIHIIPLYNPDGYAANQRRNANYIDLNRNFPEPAGTDPIQELENINFMSHAESNHFVISQNGHGGALVVNYPWDYTYTLAPDDAAIVQMALEYSTYNLPMYNGSFPQGITNGAAWYVITGSLQDWSYDQTGCIDVTVEISNVKWPEASTLVGFWDDNRESLMHFVKSARYGLNGVVTDADTGLPLDATVSVSGIASEVQTDPTCGDYYKLLDTGTYDIMFEAAGYVTQTLMGVSTTWGMPTVLNVQLQPLAARGLTAESRRSPPIGSHPDQAPLYYGTDGVNGAASLPCTVPEPHASLLGGIVWAALAVLAHRRG